MAQRGWKFFCMVFGSLEIVAAKLPPMSDLTPGPNRLPHGAWKRLLGGPDVIFSFGAKYSDAAAAI